MKIQQTEGSFSIIDLSEDELWQIVSCLKFNDDLGKGISGAVKSSNLTDEFKKQIINLPIRLRPLEGEGLENQKELFDELNQHISSLLDNLNKQDEEQS